MSEDEAFRIASQGHERWWSSTARVRSVLHQAHCFPALGQPSLSARTITAHRRGPADGGGSPRWRAEGAARRA